jgi:hypothetical protein
MRRSLRDQFDPAQDAGDACDPKFSVVAGKFGGRTICLNLDSIRAVAVEP